MSFLDKPEQLSTFRIRAREFRTRHLPMSVVPLIWLASLLLAWNAASLAATSSSRSAENATTNSASQSQNDLKSQDDIKELILGLGDSDHLKRNESEQALLKIGEPAIKPLQSVLSFEDSTVVPDNEIRLRVTRLLILIQREVRESKLAEFLAGTRDDIELAGWADFREIVGNQKNARHLFTELHESRSRLLNSPKKGRLETENELHKSIVNWIRLSSNGNADSVINNLTAVLFAASWKSQWEPDKPASVPRVVASDNKRIQQVLVQSQLIKAVESHEANAEIIALISHWLDCLHLQPSNSSKNIAISISVIDAYQLRTKSELPLKYALDKELPVHIRSTSIDVLSRVGTAEMSSKLGPLLLDCSIVGSYLPTGQVKQASETTDEQDADLNPLLEVQLRDLALATLIILNGNSPDEFGFQPQAFHEDKLLINQAGFLSDKERTAAFTNWENRSSNKEEGKQENTHENT